MSTRQASDSDDPLIESIAQLAEPMAAGEKPRENWRIGTEHEKLVYRTTDHHAPSYDEPGGIRDLLMAMTEFGWSPVEENGTVIAMAGDDGAISLEPAGQLELSGAPLENLHQTCAETGRHLKQVKAIGARTDTGFLGLGMWPDKRRDELPVMPKGRYAIMLRHMPRVGNLGLDMMLRTCTIQTNLDYGSEADMVQKFRVSLALQPLATALFANSPFTEGKPNGFLSYRSHIWSDTDPHRTGMLPFVFEAGLRLSALCRIHARRADVFRLPRWQIHRCRRAVVPRLHRRQAARAAGRAPAHQRLDRPPLHRLPRSPAEKLPRNARGRRRPVEPHLRAAGLLGGAALRPVGARCRLGSGQRLGHGGPRGTAQRGAEAGSRCALCRAAARCAILPPK